jgi:hypothetical protein
MTVDDEIKRAIQSTQDKRVHDYLIVGKIVSETKEIELNINHILAQYIGIQDSGFFHSILMSSDCMSFGAKVSALKSIDQIRGQNINFECFHTVNRIRNNFAHQVPALSQKGSFSLTQKIQGKKNKFGWSHTIKSYDELVTNFNQAKKQCHSIIELFLNFNS